MQRAFDIKMDPLRTFDIKEILQSFFETLKLSSCPLIKRDEIWTVKSVDPSADQFSALWLGIPVSVKYIGEEIVAADGRPGVAQQVLLNSEIERFMSEINILKDLRHLNIISYLAFGVDTTRRYVVQEQFSDESLFDCLAKDQAIESIQKHFFATDILSAMIYLHNNNIIHEDLKSMNILVGPEMNLKVTNFGITVNPHRKDRSLEWLAPEYISRPDRSSAKEMDVFGFA